ncbi:MAG: hypothetical protein EOO88_33205 [Pedobacter sp.]|nr:MAG: hypothetical protein EOO88_33205 [Pedobacter sp.]
MGYQDIARKAAIESGKTHDPESAWRHFAKLEYPNSVEGEKKACPRNAFLGLCQQGFIKGVRKKIYTTSYLNAGYAVKAVEILMASGGEEFTPASLWKEVLAATNAGPKQHNSQMDVVLELWKAGMITH